MQQTHAEIRDDADAARMPSAGRTAVGIERLGQRFGANTVLQGVDLAIGEGEVVALLGPSGCGKTTLLRLLAGLLRPSEGRIAIGGEVVADSAGGFVPPERRSIGMVFQDYALWPHMSVAANVSFPLEMRRVPRDERRVRVNEALRLVGLDAMAHRPPAELSGGQQQRVALARAVVSRPALLLFDEPLSNLDRELRETLVVEIAALLRALGTTAVYVTHDQAEAFAIADRVAVMASGRLAQVAAPEKLVQQPENAAVADFLKLGLVLPAALDFDSLVLEGGEGGADAALPLPAGLGTARGRGRLFVPRSAVALSEPGRTPLHGVVVHNLFRGDGYLVQVRLETGARLDFASGRRLREGSRIGIDIRWDRARWFPESGRAGAAPDAERPSIRPIPPATQRS
ncbi:MAG TPA: ABC transporter ATP-binding protein [Dongiaceae bacterium]|nr:ABC transporter ATP-binding protein [Dongiaceae bacterium]